MKIGRTPLLLPLIALISGITATMVWPGSALLISSTLIMAACCLWYFRSLHAALFCLFGSIGAFVQHTSAQTPSIILDSEPHTYVATVKALRHDDGSRLVKCDIDGVGAVDVRLYGAEPLIGTGDVLRLSARLQKPEHVQPIVPDEIDFSISADAVAVCRVSSADVSLIKHHTSLRQTIVDKILGSHLNDATGAMLCALIVGDTDLLTDTMRSEFSAAGLSHVLAISGLHVGVITMLIALALLPLYLGRHNRSRLLLTIGLLWAYAYMTDFTPSVTRAVIMASVYMLGRIIQRPGIPLNSLFFAAILILVVSPDSLTSIGFQLSFMAVAGILIFYPLINQVDRRNHPVLYRIVGYLAVSIAAMSFTGILAAYYFHSYPLYFLLANLLIAPLLPLMIGGGALLVLLEFIGIGTQWLCRVLDLISSLCEGIASAIASIPGHSVDGLYFHWSIVLAIFTALFLVAFAGYRKRLAPLLAAVAVVTVSIQFHYIFKPSYPSHEFYFLNERMAADILVRNADTLYLLTSARTSLHSNEQLERCRSRFRHYQNRRAISTMKLCPDTILSPWFSRRGPHFSIGGHRYRFLSDNAATPQMRIDYLVVARGFTGDVVAAASAFMPDSAVILSTSLHPRRLNRYCAELKTASVPFLIR